MEEEAPDAALVGWLEDEQLDASELDEDLGLPTEESETDVDEGSEFSCLSGDSARPGRRFRQRKVEPAAQRLGVPYLTKYERARVISARAVQISRGSPARINPMGNHDPVAIAKLELEAGRTPFLVKRKMPDERVEELPLSELLPR